MKDVFLVDFLAQDTIAVAHHPGHPRPVVACFLTDRNMEGRNTISLLADPLRSASPHHARQDLFKDIGSSVTLMIHCVYLALLKKILEDEGSFHGKNGCFLAASGNVAWEDLPAAMPTLHMRRSHRPKMLT